MNDISLTDELKDFYNKYYDGPSEWRQLGAIDKTNNILTLCELYTHKIVLEIGSGEGSILQRLSELHFADFLFSLEISEIAIDIINKRKIKILRDCRLFDGYNIPYDDNIFDLVILTHVLEHVEHPDKLLLKAGRVAPRVFVEVPLEDNIRFKKGSVPNKSGHLNFYSVETFKNLIQNCGFNIIAQTITNSSYKMYKFHYGNTAFLRYLIKELILKTMPSPEGRLFTYNRSLLCTKTAICPQARPK